MRIIRFLGNIALWLGALLGIVAGGVWIAGQTGFIQPLIVISGSMEPGIKTGDLLIDRWIPTSDVEVGDVLTLHSEMTGNLVTHRVVTSSIENDGWTIRMKGDDNADEDLETYIVGDEVLTPLVQIPAGGKVVSKMMEPAVAMPILLSLIALLGLSLLDEPPKVVRRAVGKVRQHDPRVDELDAELAAAGVDVEQLREMDALELGLYALDIDVEPDAPAADVAPSPAPQSQETVKRPRNGRGVEDGLWDHRLPPSDGVGLVRISSRIPPPSLTSPFDPLLPAAVGHRTPARSG